MNQILSGGLSKESQQKQYKNVEKNNKANIKSIIKFFSILIILFSITIMTQSTYSIINSKPKLKDNVKVSIERIGIEIKISIIGEKPIKQMSYRWGDNEETFIEGNDTIQLEKIIEIPDGNNILNMTIVDFYGNKTQYNKQYINERNDKVKPTIEITVIGNELNLIAKDETEISYLTYKWNDEHETRVDLEINAEDKTKIEKKVEVRKGQNTLTITAVDKDGNKVTKTENIKGANKPTFTISAEGNEIVINAKDEEGISKISITVDGITTDTGDTPINQKEITARQEITTGEHTITIKVTNINGLSEEQSFTAVL